MNEHLMGGHSGNPTWSEYALDDLQDRMDTASAEESGLAVPVGTAKDMLDDLQYRVCKREQGDVLGGAQDGTSHSITRDELDKLNGRVVRRGEQPGKA